MSNRQTLLTKLLISLTVTIVLVVSAAGLLYLFIDIDAYKDDVAARIEALTGREVAINGDIDLNLSLNPSLSVEDVTLGNASWGSKPQMLKIGRLQGRVALLPLLSGNIEIRELAFFDTELLLETDAKGLGNWSLDSPQDASTPSSISLPVIEQLSIRNLRLAWRGHTDTKAAVYRLGNLEISGIGTRRPIHIEAIAGDSDESPIPLWALHLTVKDTDAGFQVSDIVLTADESDLSGELSLSVDEKKLRLTGSLSSNRLRPNDITRMITDIFDPDNVTQDHGISDTRVFPNTPFELNIPRDLTMDLTYQAQRLGDMSLALQDLSARFKAEQGVVSIVTKQARLDDANVSAELSIDSRQTKPLAELTLTGKALQLGRISQALTGKAWLDSRGDLDVKLQGSGHSLAQIMASATGNTRLLVHKGNADLRDIDTLVGGLTALTNLVRGDSNQVLLNCIASSFEVKNGIATSRVMLADTENATLYGSGTIDLRSEQLDLILKPKPKQASLNVAVPVEIRGTLKEPVFTPEKVATAKKGAGVLAAIGLISFPPAILLGLGELGSGEENPCLTIAAQANSAENPTIKPKRKGGSTLERAADGVGDALDNLGSAVKDLFN